MSHNHTKASESKAPLFNAIGSLKDTTSLLEQITKNAPAPKGELYSSYWKTIFSISEPGAAYLKNPFFKAAEEIKKQPNNATAERNLEKIIKMINDLPEPLRTEIILTEMKKGTKTITIPDYCKENDKNSKVLAKVFANAEKLMEPKPEDMLQLLMGQCEMLRELADKNEDEYRKNIPVTNSEKGIFNKKLADLVDKLPSDHNFNLNLFTRLYSNLNTNLINAIDSGAIADEELANFIREFLPDHDLQKTDKNSIAPLEMAINNNYIQTVLAIMQPLDQDNEQVNHKNIVLEIAKSLRKNDKETLPTVVPVISNDKENKITEKELVYFLNLLTPNNHLSLSILLLSRIENRLIENITSIGGQQNGQRAEELANAMFEKIMEHKSPSEQYDYVLLLLDKYQSAARENKEVITNPIIALLRDYKAKNKYFNLKSGRNGSYFSSSIATQMHLMGIRDEPLLGKPSMYCRILMLFGKKNIETEKAKEIQIPSNLAISKTPAEKLQGINFISTVLNNRRPNNQRINEKIHDNSNTPSRPG